MESLGRARIHVQPDFLVLVEREIHERKGSRFEGVHHWNASCAAHHEALFARVKQDVPSLAAWVNSQFEAAVYEDPHSPLCVIAANNGDMDEIHTRLDDYARDIPQLTVVRNDVYARFSHAAYNKGTALAEVTRLTGLSRDQVFAVGDHMNDLPMLRSEFARFIATTANAVPAVRAAVTGLGGYISALDQGRGVADALRFFLGPTARNPETDQKKGH
jgi:hydroxymethylpyrimidine pyrophosphatase-like HAD family hydrolase